MPPLHGSCHILHLRMSYSVGRERTGKAEPVVPAAEGILGVVRLQHRTDIGQPHAVAGFTLGGTGQLPLRDLHILSDPVAHRDHQLSLRLFHPDMHLGRGRPVPPPQWHC